jgi:hypothetical protein
LTLGRTDADIDRIITAFGQVAALIAEAQQDRTPVRKQQIKIP